MRVKLCGRTLFSKVQKQSKLGTERLTTNGGKLKVQPFQSHCRVVPTMELQYVARASTTSCGQKQKLWVQGASVLGEMDDRNYQILKELKSH